MNSGDATNDLTRAHALLRAGNVVHAQALCRAVLARQPDHVDALRLLGQLLVQSRHFNEAALHLRRAVALGAADSEPHEHLAQALIGLGRDEEAIAVLSNALRGRAVQVPMTKLLANALHRCGHADEARALLGDTVFVLGATPASTDLLEHWAQLLPDDPTPAHRLAALRGDAPPARAADEYVTYLFDRYADTFDESLSGLGYHGPALIQRLLQTAGIAPDGQLRVLDAGCGTGLCGPIVRPFAAHLTGVDLSAAMVDKARQRGAHDVLVVAELTDYLGRHAAQFDLILSMDTLIYFGDLSTVFRNAANALRPAGYFAFTLETADDAPLGYRLNANARYSHTTTYVTQQLTDAGFAIQALDAVVTRHNDGAPVQGLAVLARRGDAV